MRELSTYCYEWSPPVCNLTPLNNLYFRPTLLVLLHTSSFTRFGLLIISL
jgi:hypothetical protein